MDSESSAPTAQDRVGVPSVDVVIPVLNEEAALPELCRRLRALPVRVRPIFVDNGSTDRTLEILRAEPGVELIEHGRNLGYGASLRDGMRAARTEYLVILDADLEFPPEEIPSLITALEHADVVYASRFLGRRAGEVGMPRLRVLGNRLVSALYSRLFGQSVTDLYTGFKGLKTALVREIELQRDGFEQVLELACRLARKGVKIHEVPVRYEPRRTGRSKMRHLSETLRFLWWLLRYRLTDR